MSLHVGDDGELLDGKFCIHCGAVNRLQAQRCRSCGTAFTSAKLASSRADLRLYFAAALAILFICYMLSDRSYHPPAEPSILPTAAKIQSIHTLPNVLSSISTWLVFENLLPSEADSACIAQLPQNEPLIAANYEVSSNATGVALISDDGKHLCRLTRPTTTDANDYLRDSSPHWVSKTQIAFNSNRINKYSYSAYDAFVINVDGSHFQHITMATGSGSASYETIFDEPIWSPDGKSIAFFAKGSDYKQSISVVNANGTGMRQLTTGEDVDNLAWSPDSRWIYFAASSGLYRLSADGLSLKPILYPVLNDINFAVSPDGESLVIVGNDPQAGNELSVLNINGGYRRVLLPPMNSAHLTICLASPLWLPDSILFIAAKMGESCHIYKMNVDGSGIEKFYDGPELIGSLTTYYTN